MEREKLLPFFSLIPTDLPCCIAGSSVVDFDKASDVDIWILGVKDLSDALGQMRVAEIKQRIAALAIWDNPDMSMRLPGDKSAYFNSHLVLGEGVLYGKKFQIIAASADNVGELLNTFDLSVCMAGLIRHSTGGTDIVTIPQTTKPSVPIRVTNQHTPMRTILRLRKLMGRYKILCDMRDLYQLATSHLPEPKAKKPEVPIDCLDEEIPF